MVVELIVCLLLTLFAYLIFPLSYKLTKGKVSERKGKKLALWNSIICEAIFTIGSISIGLEPATNGTLFAQGFLYYFVAKGILIDPNKKDEPAKSKAQEIENDEENEQIEEDEESSYNMTPVEKTKVKEKQGLQSKVVNSSNTQRISTIKRLQYVIVTVVVCLLLFSIIYPVSINAAYQSKIPSTTSAKSIQLTRLDSNKKVYCEMIGGNNYVYILNEDGNIDVYKFQNYTMYSSSNSVRTGYATSVQLKNYFTSNIFAGKPSLHYIMPAAVPVGLVIGVLMIGSCCVMLFLIHRFAEEEMFNLRKSDSKFKKVNNNYKKEEISIYEFKRLNKQLFSERIVKNNGIFKIFTSLY